MPGGGSGGRRAETGKSGRSGKAIQPVLFVDWFHWLIVYSAEDGTTVFNYEW